MKRKRSDEESEETSEETSDIPKVTFKTYEITGKFNEAELTTFCRSLTQDRNHQGDVKSTGSLTGRSKSLTTQPKKCIFEIRAKQDAIVAKLKLLVAEQTVKFISKDSFYLYHNDTLIKLANDKTPISELVGDDDKAILLVKYHSKKNQHENYLIELDDNITDNIPEDIAFEGSLLLELSKELL